MSKPEQDPKSAEVAPESRQCVATQGNYSPGIVMGDFNVHSPPQPRPLPLTDALKIRLSINPSHRGHFTEFEGKRVFFNGCRFELSLANASHEELIVRQFKMQMVWEPLERLRFGDRNRRYGGVMIPHQLYIELRKTSASGWWLLSDGHRVSDAPRPIADARQDIFASDSGPRMAFRLKPGEIELIEGALLPREDGLYRVRFQFGAIRAADAASIQTAEWFVATAEVSNGS